jgi:hypothetical protein
MTKLEKDIERRLRREVEACGGLCLKWVCPGWAGVPDRLVLLPGGRIIFVELKRPKGGVVSALQLKWWQWLTDRGFTVEYISNDRELERLVRWVRSYVENLGGKK